MTPGRPARAVLLLGGGGHAAVVADAITARGWIILGCLDDADPRPPSATAPGQRSSDLRRLGSVKDLHTVLRDQPRDVLVHAAVGEPLVRRRWMTLIDELGACADPVIHPAAVVSGSVAIEPGAFIGPLAVVNARAKIGRGAIVNSGAIIEHDCVLGEFCHVAPGAVLAGNVTIGAGSLIGAGAAVRPGVRIGDSVTIGLGAAVVDDVPDGVTAVGVPAQWSRVAAR